MGEERVVHRPEFALVMSGNGSLGRKGGLRMCFKRELFEDELDFARVGLHHGIDFADRERAVRALKVGKLDQGDRGVLGAANRRTGGGDGDRIFEYFGTLRTLSPLGSFGGLDRVVFIFPRAKCVTHGGGDAFAPGARGVFHSTLGNLHGTAAGAIVGAKEAPEGAGFQLGEAGEIHARQVDHGLPVGLSLRENEGRAQECETGDSAPSRGKMHE